MHGSLSGRGVWGAGQVWRGNAAGQSRERRGMSVSLGGRDAWGAGQVRRVDVADQSR